MKYNKIAMLVAGGLMVGAVNAGYANTTTTLGSSVEEYGSIEQYSIDGTSVTITPNGDSTFQTLLTDYAASLTDTEWCVRNNSATQYIANAIDSLTVAANDTSTQSTSGAVGMGGYSLTLAVNALKHSNFSDLARASKGVIDTTVTITAGDLLEGDNHKHMNAQAGNCGIDSAMFALTTTFPDEDNDKYAGTYAGSITLTLTGHEDDI